MAIEGKESIQERFALVLDRLRDLGQEVEDLSRRVDALERSGAHIGSVAPTGGIPNGAAASVVAAAYSPWSWLGHSLLLQRAATVCFVLVGALVLRTLNEYGVFGRRSGVLLGVTYCALLVALGWRQLARGRPGRRVLPECGVVLLCAILLEAHGRYQLLAAPAVTWALLGALVAVGALGLRFHSGGIVAFATLSTSVSALALSFPHVSFPHGATVLLAAHVVAFLALGIARMQWLSWVTFALTSCFWVTWSVVLRAALHEPAGSAEAAFSAWFLPCLAVFALVLVASSTRRAAKTRDVEAFHVFLPVANVLWAHGAALSLSTAGELEPAGLGAVAVVAAGVHFGIARFLWCRWGSGSTALSAFATAGAVHLALASPLLFGGIAWALPAWSLLALALAWSATRAGSSRLRFTSYLLQLAACGAAVVSGLFRVSATTLLPASGAALFVALFAAAHYSFEKRRPPPPDTWLARVDTAHHAPIVVLWVSAIAAFAFLRLMLHRGLIEIGAPDANTYYGLQSVIVNCMGAALLLWGARWRENELLVTGALATLIGGLLVFGVNLLSGHGLPLVLAVLSFGTTTGVGSLALRKWLGAGSASPGGVASPSIGEGEGNG